MREENFCAVGIGWWFASSSAETLKPVLVCDEETMEEGGCRAATTGLNEISSDKTRGWGAVRHVAFCCKRVAQRCQVCQS